MRHTPSSLRSILGRLPKIGKASWLPKCAADWFGQLPPGKRPARGATSPSLAGQATRFRRARRWRLRHAGRQAPLQPPWQRDHQVESDSSCSFRGRTRYSLLRKANVMGPAPTLSLEEMIPDERTREQSRRHQGGRVDRQCARCLNRVKPGRSRCPNGRMCEAAFAAKDRWKSEDRRLRARARCIAHRERDADRSPNSQSHRAPHAAGPGAVRPAQKE